MQVWIISPEREIAKLFLKLREAHKVRVPFRREQECSYAESAMAQNPCRCMHVDDTQGLETYHQSQSLCNGRESGSALLRYVGMMWDLKMLDSCCDIRAKELRVTHTHDVGIAYTAI